MTSLAQTSKENEQLQAIVSELLGDHKLTLSPTGGGGNSRIYRVDCSDDSRIALKAYPPQSNDKGDRLDHEYGALTFLYERTCGQVPQAIYADVKKRFALYEWINGDLVKTPQMGDIKQVLDFLKVLHRLHLQPQAQQLPMATEACLSARTIIMQIDQRVNNLLTLTGDYANSQLFEFLHQSFYPLYREVCQWVQQTYIDNKLVFNKNIDVSQRSLNPSDFGFHNILMEKNDKLRFIDFEYFGWDDPAKLISDFLWNPGTSISLSLQHHFVANTLAIYCQDEQLWNRLRCLHPLFGLRWCMIVLNEFLPTGWARRSYASSAIEDWEIVKKRQLQKAENYHKKVHETYQCFDYACHQ